MERLKSVVIGFAIGLLLEGCAHATFAYKYYGLDAVSYDGTLSGPTAPQDQSLKLCQPTLADKSPCVVMLSTEFLRLKGDHLNLENELVACQQGSAKAVSR